MNYPHDFIKEFIQLYRSYPCLWQVKSRYYKSKVHRDYAYQALVKKMKEVDATADRKTVSRKINILRTSFRREHKKICSSRLKNIAFKYKSPLWYYDLMKFVVEQNEQMNSQDLELYQGINNEAHESTIDSKEVYEETLEYNVEKIEASSPPPSPSSLQTDLQMDLQTNLQANHDCDTESFLKTSKGILQESDVYQIFGNYVTAKLREVTPRQSIIAEKLIADVLHRAAFGTLNENTCLSVNMQNT